MTSKTTVTQMGYALHRYTVSGFEGPFDRLRVVCPSGHETINLPEGTAPFNALLARGEVPADMRCLKCDVTATY